jgi:hypothetical protein
LTNADVGRESTKTCLYGAFITYYGGIMTNSKQKIYPILIALTKETRPKQITFYGLTEGRFKNVKLPKRLALLAVNRKLTVIKWCIKTYLKRFNGICPFWGKVIGFQYSDSNCCYEINSNGTSIVRIDESKKMTIGLAYALIR